jgi:large repetitive protein
VGRPTTAHTYATPGDRVVRLTVTDSAHTTGTTTRTVTPTAPDPSGPQVWASDAFSRTSTNGFGTAPTGGAWSIAGTTSSFSVDGSAGRISLGAGVGPGAYLAAVSTSDADTRVTFSTAQPMTGNGATLSLVGRRVVGSGDYRAPLRLLSNGTAQLSLVRATSTGAETSLRAPVTVPGALVQAGQGVVVRMSATGTSPTVLRAKAWLAGTAEPAAWLLTTTDTTVGLQVPGSIGVRPYLSSTVTNAPVVVGVDDLSSGSTNLPPTASQASSCTGLTCSFDGTGSTDPEGPVASWTWDFGDGSPPVSGATVTHTYAAAGAYSAALTVADGAGATGLTASTVTPTAPPAGSPPTASFTSSCTELSCSFDGTASSDADGSVTGWAWDFGDGATGTGSTVTHDYATGGPVTVSLVVTDSSGATGSANGTANPVAPPSAGTPPTASFTASCPALTCSFDGSASTDADGPLASWAWDFGDGTTGAGATPTHAYPTAGDYTVRLTVTDGTGDTGTAAQLLSPRPPANPAPTVWAQDAFNRTVTGGLGTAPTGGTWSVTSGASTFSVDGQTGRVSLAAGSGPGAYLAQVAASDTDTSVSFSVDKPVTGGGAYLSLVGRRVPAAGDYRATLRLVAGGSAQLSLLRVSSTGAETAVRAAVTVPGLTVAAGDRVAVRLQVVGTGTTTVRGKAWRTTSSEPAGWLLTGSDTTAGLQVKGSVGVRPYLSSTTTNAPVVVSVDDLLSRVSGSAPTAVAQATCTGRTCSLDGAGSSDPDGPVASWVWDFGDGTPPASGVTVSHTYATPGARRVTLTVTDATGWTAVTTRSVDVS